jgi:chorismate-pyruvate lyase
MRRSIFLLALIVAATPRLVLAADWPATDAGRAAARDALARFEAALDATDSASEALRRWCVDNHIADPAVIRAERVRDVDKPADADVRQALGAAPDEALRYRRVRLRCGDRVLSEADNWYRPGRLTTAMNETLDATDRPFGVVVGPLGFHRKTLGVDWLFDPMRASAVAGTLVAPPAVLRHRAVLIAADGAPFSLVAETYTDEVLAPPR